MAIKRIKTTKFADSLWSWELCVFHNSTENFLWTPCESVCEPLTSAGSGPSSNESARNWVRFLSVSSLDTDTGMARKIVLMIAQLW